MGARSSTHGDDTSPATCAACEYDLRGASDDTQDAVCPECGHTVAGPGHAHFRERRVLSALGRRLAVVGTLGVLLVVTSLVVFREHTLYIAPFAVLFFPCLAMVRDHWRRVAVIRSGSASGGTKYGPANACTM